MKSRKIKIEGWVTRDEIPGIVFHSYEPEYYTSDYGKRWTGEPLTSIRFCKPLLGLRPGQKKRCTITVEIHDE